MLGNNISSVSSEISLLEPASFCKFFRRMMSVGVNKSICLNAILFVITNRIECIVMYYQVSLIQSVFVAITSGVIYWTMIKPSEQQKSSNKIQNFLVGYGFVIPLCLIYPRFIIQFFGIRNKVIRFAFTAVPIASLFRCAEGKKKHIITSVRSLIDCVLHTTI